MTKRVALASGVLLLGLLIAVVGATIALRLIGSETSGPGGRPLSEADVRRSFAKTAGQVAPSSPAATPVPGQRHSPGSRTPGSQSHAPVPHSTLGGTVFASCAAGQVRLTNWIPQSGYSSDGYSPGPADLGLGEIQVQRDRVDRHGHLRRRQAPIHDDDR